MTETAKPHIPTIDELRQEIGNIRQASHNKRDASSSMLDRIALLVTQRVGTFNFFILIMSWTVFWLGWNMFVPTQYRFDPGPAFVLWLFISNLIQLHLMPLIMIGQNILGKRADQRSEHDYQTDKKSEKEVETILLHLEAQEKMTQQLLDKVTRIEEILSVKH